jgi:hypothetical protein
MQQRETVLRKHVLQKVASERLAVLFRIWEVHGSILGPEDIDMALLVFLNPFKHSAGLYLNP